MIGHISPIGEASWLLALDTFAVVRIRTMELQVAGYYQTLLTVTLESNDVVPVALGAAETVD